MTSLDPGAAAPEEKRTIETPLSSKVSGRRRTVRLTTLTDDAPVDTPPDPPSVPMPRSGGAHRADRGADRGHVLPTSRDDWLVLAERVVGDWAATLRAALLLVLAVAAMLMVIGIVFGVGPALAIAFVALLVLLAGRRRDGPDQR